MDGGTRKMSVIYVKEQGAVIRKKGARISVSKSAEDLFEIPISNLDGLAIFGNAQLTTQALHYLLIHGVDISYYTYGGKYLGRTAAEFSKNIFLRFFQYQLYNDESRKMEMAKIIVENKIWNQIRMIQNFRWDDTCWKTDVEQMEKLCLKLENTNTSGEILGIEGMCSQIYFSLFGKMFKCEFKFCGRNRRPPRDPINAIISLGYTFLTKEICSILETESFEPYLGFLHGIRYGRKSLALDIIEEFRQPVIDRFVLKIFNKHMISKYDFEQDEKETLLTTGGFKKFCKEYERWMTEARNEGKRNSYRKLIQGQIRILKRCIQEGENYTPYRWEE